MDNISIRRLSLDDLDQLTALEGACFSAPWSREAYRQELEDNDLACYWGLFADHRLVGFAGYWLILDEAHITNVAVAPDCRRRGLGRLLVQTLCTSCLAAQGRYLTLEARAGNLAALRLYEEAGFTREGRRRDYYDQPVEDAIIMWKDLQS